MTEEERIRLGDDRRLIFENFCHGVSKPVIAETFKRSVSEVEREILFVARKCREHRHLLSRKAARENRQLLVQIYGETDEDILRNRDAFCRTLALLGPITLSSDLLIPTLTTHRIEADRPDDLLHAVRMVGGRAQDHTSHP